MKTRYRTTSYEITTDREFLNKLYHISPEVQDMRLRLLIADRGDKDLTNHKSWFQNHKPQIPNSEVQTSNYKLRIPT